MPCTDSTATVVVAHRFFSIIFLNLLFLIGFWNTGGSGGSGKHGVAGQQYIGLITMPEPAKQLRKMNVYADKISLSGYSSGGSFAQQLQISYSSMFSGIGVFCQTFYRCGPGDGIQASFDETCTKLGNSLLEEKWSPNRALDDIIHYHLDGLIEDPRNLKNTKLYVYAPTKNWLFSVPQELRVVDVYKPFIRNKNHIYTQIWEANHTMPSNEFGGSCLDSDSKGYYVGDCGLSGAFEALRFIHGRFWVPNYPKPHQNLPLQPLRTFDQTEFFYGVKGEHFMDKLGFFYIPSKCQHHKCLVHFYFHGCRSGREFLGDNHIRNSGFLQVAELNSIIMVFPQALSNKGENMIGCWDTYGLTGPYFATQKGAQVTIVRNILARILGEDKKVASKFSRFSFPFSIPKLELIFPTNVQVVKA